ncbi:hypothetical protein QTP88_001204 [Uroleucon formosanum]
MRHDCLVKRITGGLREKRYEVEVEHLYKLHGGNLKPDIVATISDETRGRFFVICDVRVVSGAEPRTWHSSKVDKYADRADLKAAIRARHLLTEVRTVTDTLTWRGIWVPESFRELRELGLSRGLLEGLVTRILRGTQLNWRVSVDWRLAPSASFNPFRLNGINAKQFEVGYPNYPLTVSFFEDYGQDIKNNSNHSLAPKYSTRFSAYQNPNDKLY